MSKVLADPHTDKYRNGKQGGVKGIDLLTVDVSESGILITMYNEEIKELGFFAISPDTWDRVIDQVQAYLDKVEVEGAELTTQIEDAVKPE